MEKTIQIHNIPYSISPFGIGTWQLGGPTQWGNRQTGWGETDYSEAKQALRILLDSGIQLIDTADSYGKGKSEQIIGEVLQDFSASDEVIVCSKFGTRETSQGQVIKDFSPLWLEEAVNNSLQRLKRERIEILLLHSPPDNFNWDSYDPTPFEKLIQQGKIATYGVSVKTIKGAKEVLKKGFGYVIEGIYNVWDRRAEDVLPLCAEKKYTFLARVPLASGYLSPNPPKNLSKDDIRASFPNDMVNWLHESREKLAFLNDLPGGISVSALRFVAFSPYPTIPIPGIRKISYSHQLLRARELGPLPNNIIESIQEAIPDVFAGWK